MKNDASHTLAELAERLGGSVTGEPGLSVEGIAPLQTAGPRELSFLANPRYLPLARATHAAAVIVGPGIDLAGKALLVVPEPYLALAKVLEIFHPTPRPAPG